MINDSFSTIFNHYYLLHLGHHHNTSPLFWVILLVAQDSHMLQMKIIKWCYDQFMSIQQMYNVTCVVYAYTT